MTAATLTFAPAADAASTACLHCGAAMPEGEERFCCAGCAGAYALIRELGLGQFYARRTLDGAPQAKPETAPPSDPSSFVRDEGDGTVALDLLVEGLRCAACVWLIETALHRRPEIAEARVNLSTRRLRLRWRGARSLGAELADTVQRLGYRVAPFDPAQLASSASRQETELLRAVAVAGFAAGNIMLLSVAVWSGNVADMGVATRDLLHWVSALIALPAVAYAGLPFFKSAWAALRVGRSNMDVPISIGVILAVAMSLVETAGSGTHAYFDSAVTLLFFLLIGRYLDHRARGRVRSVAENLLALGAAPVTLVGEDGATRHVAQSALRTGDTILVAAGERVGADGRIAAGRSELDKSLVDGETIPASVATGDRVFAGMLNLSAPLRITVEATGERTLLAEIVRLMEAAEQGRTRFVVLADRVARHYAPAVHTIALATFLGWTFALGAPWQAALLNAVAVLIITCPCALGLAVPVVQVIASGRLMRSGILLKSATALERLGEIDTVVFDKTGTLTLGRPTLRHFPDATALREAAAIAASSRHPLSRALRAACPDVLAATNVEEHPGAGLSLGATRLGSAAFCGVVAEAAGDGPELWLARPGRESVRFVFGDELRPDAAAVVAALRRDGKRVLLLSGDRPAVVGAVAASLGIAEWEAGCAPAQKCARLAALAAEGAKVLMVGDGLNDAPALAAAYVSMSPASGADVSQAAADIVFQGVSLGAVGETLCVAARSLRLVRQNIVLAILYNALAVPLAIAGLVTPLLAAAAMSSSSILVIANALRLKGERQ
jgi:Cu2+-exporting ATPase